MRTALISGAGIAGATAAYWLAKAGFQVTVVEHARVMRYSGSPVDVRGSAKDVAERMGVMARVRAADTCVRDMVFVNARGRVLSRVNMHHTWAEPSDVELPRGELAAILREAVPDEVEFQFGNSVTALTQDADGVGGGRPGAAFMFRAPQIPQFDHRDLDQHKRLLCDAYAGAGWRVPELLERVRAAEDLYFDSVSRIQVPTWCRGRIGLVGDAASCVSLFGDGSSLAMTGAFTLADSLNGDIPAGLHTYEVRHRPQRAAKENSVAYATRLLIPATSAGIAVRNVAMYLVPLVNAAHRRLAECLDTVDSNIDSTAEAKGENHDRSQLRARGQAGRRIVRQRNWFRRHGPDTRIW